jgi:hypothetical protein
MDSFRREWGGGSVTCVEVDVPICVENIVYKDMWRQNDF